jgi:hypothetical protein
MAGRYRIDFAPAARRQLAKLAPDVIRIGHRGQVYRLR